jgi:predicted dehydrogenase
MKNFKIGVIGCGGIGIKRSSFLPSNVKIESCYDIDMNVAALFSRSFNCQVSDGYESLLENRNIDAVIIATPHNVLASIASCALQSLKHVFIEKPAGMNVSELSYLIIKRDEFKRVVQVGFNHRYHRAVLKAQEIIKCGFLGDLMFVRGRYGHGGRIGYEKEWRSNPRLSGGGELMDQGPHLIDLSRLFLGEFPNVCGFAHTYFWDSPVDDNAFMTLTTANNQTAFLHVSSTEWKNLFSFEIYGTKGKLEISGLGGSYGVEKITHFNMLPQMGPPETTIWEYPMLDNSWGTELTSFFNAVMYNTVALSGLEDSLAAHRVIEKIYSDSGYDFNT